MEIVGPRILLLGGRLERTQHRRPVSSWLDRLESRGVAVQLLCCSAASPDQEDPRLIVVPTLASRWFRGLATHWLRSDQRLRRPDLIHVLDSTMADLAIALAESTKVPYVQTAEGFRTLEHGLRISRRWCRRVAVTSQELASDLAEVLGVPPSLMTVVPPGVVCPALEERGERWKEVPVIGTGGVINASSGFSVFLEAARLILESGHDAEFILRAHGDEPVEIRRLAQDLRIGERLTVVDESFDGMEFWSVVDIYCQPALAATAGLLLLSAASHAIPIIATNVKGPREIIEPGVSGVLVPRGDARSLARAVVQLLDDPQTARRLGIAAREFVIANYDPGVEADLLTALYRSVLDGRAGIA